MHLPDGILSLPVVATTSAVAATGFAFGLYHLRGRSQERTSVLMGMMAAFVFAAQMVNFPVFPGVSGHLMGGVLASVVLGPWAGSCVMASVLIVQALLFADGGLTALGANFLNMGLVGAGIGYAIYAELRRVLGGGVRGTLIAAMLAAWISVLISAGTCAAELACSNPGIAWPRLFGWMTLIHAAIGLGEALITGLVLRSILAVRPDLIPGSLDSGKVPLGAGRFAVAGLGVAMAVALFAAPFAYDAPDGLETVTEKVGLAVPGEIEPGSNPDPESSEFAPMPDYQLPIPGVASVRLATAGAGIVGTLVVCLVGAVMAKALGRTSGRKLEASTPGEANANGA